MPLIDLEKAVKALKRCQCYPDDIMWRTEDPPPEEKHYLIKMALQKGKENVFFLLLFSGLYVPLFLQIACCCAMIQVASL